MVDHYQLHVAREAWLGVWAMKIVFDAGASMRISDGVYDSFDPAGRGLSRSYSFSLGGLMSPHQSALGRSRKRISLT